MNELHRVRILSAIVAVVILCSPAIAHAADLADNMRATVVRVSFSDLDLSSEAGLATLYQRIRSAADAACGPRHSLVEAGSLRRLSENRKCYDELYAKFVKQVEDRQLDQSDAA